MRVYVIETQSRDRYNRAPEKATWFSLTLFFGFVFQRVFQSVPLQWSISFSFSDGGEFSPMRKQNNKKNAQQYYSNLAVLFVQHVQSLTILHARLYLSI